MRNKLLKLFSIVMSILLIVYVLHEVDIYEILGQFSSLSFSWLLGIMVLLAGNLVGVTWRLHRLLAHFGAPQRFGAAFSATINGLASSLIVISLIGSVVGRQYSLRWQGVNPAMITILTGYERLVLVLVGAGLAVAGFVFTFGFETLQTSFEGVPLAQIFIAVSMAILLSLTWAPRATEYIFLARLARRTNFLRFLDVSSITVVSQLLSIATYALALLGLSIDASIWTLLACGAIVSFAASLPLSVNGWGVREIAAIAVFGQIGVGATEAVTASVVVGACSTIAVLVVTPYALATTTKMAHKTNVPAEAQASTMPRSSPVEEKLRTADHDFESAFALLVGLGAAIFLFFQIFVPIGDAGITANLADPIAILALAGVIAFALIQRELPIALGTQALAWIAGMSLVLVVGFLVGVVEYGVTPWALANRLLGWVVLLGYVACGAIFATKLGTYGLIRLLQTLVATAIVVTLIHGLVRILAQFNLIDWMPPFRFEGFSANRNTFAFQLTMIFAVALAWGQRLVLGTRKTTILALSILSFGILQTGSLTGAITWLAVLVFGAMMRPDRRRIIAWIFFLSVAVWLVGHTLLNQAIHALQYVFRESLTATGGFGSEEFLAVPGFEIIPSSVHQRWESILTGFSLWLSSPIFGAGLGAGIRASAGNGDDAVVIHSTPVWLLAEFGVAGFLVVLVPPLIWTGRACLVLWRSRESWRRKVGERLQARLGPGLAVALVFGLFSMTHDVGYQRIMWLILGALLVTDHTAYRPLVGPMIRAASGVRSASEGKGTPGFWL